MIWVAGVLAGLSLWKRGKRLAVMSELIGRMARAIFEADYPGGEVDEYRWARSEDAYLDQARAALQAQRDHYIELRGDARLYGHGFSDPYAGIIHHLDEALK